MRLTLRTLMAWMDDTLPPKDVRRIGRQLERSKFSQDLSHRIRRVVRQRRLTVPGMGTNQPVDANVVAAYLDNNLAAEVTSGFESLCLNSDVHLAEVAASHQILSVLGQPCPIPAETYAAMYRVVKGPEARIHADRVPPQVTGPNASSIGKKPIVAEDPPWPAPPFARNLPRFVAASAAVCAFLAFGSIALDRIVGPRSVVVPSIDYAEQSGEESAPEELVVQAPANLPDGDRAAENPLPVGEMPAEKPGIEPPAAQPPASAPVAAATEPKPASAESKPESPAPARNTEPAQPKAAMPVANDAPAVAKPGEKPASVARLFDAEEGESIGLNGISAIAETTILLTAPKSVDGPIAWNLWKSTPETPSLVRFAGAEPLRIESSSLELTVAPGSLVELSETEAAKWVQGDATAHSRAEGKFRLRNELGRELSIAYPADARFAVRSVPMAAGPGSRAGDDVARRLEIQADAGTLSVRIGRSEQQIAAGRTLRIDARGNEHEVVETAASTTKAPGSPKAGDPGAALVTRMMRRYLSTNRPLSTSIIDAEKDELAEVRDLAMKIAMWIDRDDIVTDILTDLDTAQLRESAILAVREASVRGESAVGRIVASVADELALNEPDAELLRSLLTGSAADEDIEGKKRLVVALEHDARLIRQLALERLMRISGRDSMGFDPDAPSAKGLDAWKMWIGMASLDSRP